MSNPRPSDWVLLKRVGRYLVGKPRMVQMFAWQDFPGVVDGFCDSEWAGDREDRTSTSGGVLQIGMHTLKTWSSTQQILALSSGEAELYAMVKGCAQAKGLCSILRDLGFDAEAHISSDASAALGMAHRQGLGRTTPRRLRPQATQQTCSPSVCHATSSSPTWRLTYVHSKFTGRRFFEVACVT